MNLGVKLEESPGPSHHEWGALSEDQLEKLWFLLNQLKTIKKISWRLISNFKITSKIWRKKQTLIQILTSIWYEVLQVTVSNFTIDLHSLTLSFMHYLMMDMKNVLKNCKWRETKNSSVYRRFMILSINEPLIRYFELFFN